MSTPSDKLASSLKILKDLQEKGSPAIRSKDLTETHRRRLLKNGFLQEVMKGWYIPTLPDEIRGDSTAWYTSFWSFCGSYFDERFKDDWCLSPEQSILLHVGNKTVPKQLLVRSVKANNVITKLPYSTSILEVRSNLASKYVTKVNGLRVYSLPYALINCSSDFYKQNPIAMRAALTIIQDASEILSLLLEGGHSIIAGRLAGAFRNIGRTQIANDILHAMRVADYDTRERDPFQESTPIILNTRESSPHVHRLNLMWNQMRSEIIKIFPTKQVLPSNIQGYLQLVEESYIKDAYNSLSIEGYRVSEALIKKVYMGRWSPTTSQNDREHYDALAARGYWQAYQKVKQSITDVLSGQNPGSIAERDLSTWYREMFAPSVAAGILKPTSLVGYRDAPVYIRRSQHIPPSKEAVRELMPAFFDLLRTETEPSVRLVLGHFFFVYIHPFMDGNGRIGRFLMNLMSASGGYPWIIIDLASRNIYMEALEKASVEQDVKPFCEFLASLIKDYKSRL